MVIAAHAVNSKGINATNLDKVQLVYIKASELQKIGTGDQMLRYKCINEYFFVDTLFDTKRSGKPSRSNTCCQLFVTDKVYIHVVPMKSNIEVIQAVNKFSKYIGAPDAIICDMDDEQTLKLLKKFCNDLGTTIRVLEDGTLWEKNLIYIYWIDQVGCPKRY